MKTYKFFLFICFFCVLFFQGKAQENWLCVYPDKKVYFEDEDKLVYCIRIDSTLNDNRTLYPFSDLHQIDGDCYSITSGSWLSKYIDLDESGNTIFVNGNNQEILIKNKAELNETWNVFEDGYIKVKGEITAISTESVLGVEDSVKTISFSVHNSDDVPIDHMINQFSVKVSKHFGLVKTVNFYYFGHAADYYPSRLGEFNLIGIDEPRLGFQPINLKEQYFDFQVGDELHIWDILELFSYSIEKKIMNRYLSRTDYEDCIVYDYECKIHTTLKEWVDGSITTKTYTSTDLLKQTIGKGLFFETEPNEPFIDNGGQISKVMIVNTPSPKMYFWDYSHLFWDSSTSCLNYNPGDACDVPGIYSPGLGGPYYDGYCELLEGYQYQRHEFVYYKKGDIMYGTPFDFVGLLPIPEDKRDIFIYPNPASNYISIKSANNEIFDNSVLEIYDIYGKKQLSRQINDSEFIDVSFLSSGLYFVFIDSRYIYKIVKE